VQAALESAIAELVLGPELELDRADMLRAFVERHGVAEADAAELVNGGLARLAVYRKLVRETLVDALRLTIPRSMARLGSVFDEYFDRFLAERAPRSHYLRDLTPELLEWCLPRWREDPRIPEYIVDLVRHEALHIEIGAKPAENPEIEPAALELEQSVRFVDAVKLVRYGFRVHELMDDVDDRTEPERRETSLLVYRSPEHEVRYLELSKLAAKILERLIDGQALGHAIERACALEGVALDASVTESTARLLADLAERGALLGATR